MDLSPFSDRTEEFVSLLAEHSQEIYVYIFRLTLNRNDADDVFQETNLVLWRKFDTFSPGTNFKSWAYRIAANQVLAWSKRVKRERLTFSTVFMETIARNMDDENFRLNERVRIFSECMDLLLERHRNLISMRYDKQLDVRDIASKKQKSVDAVYHALNRIRRKLIDCVNRKLLN